MVLYKPISILECYIMVLNVTQLTADITWMRALLSWGGATGTEGSNGDCQVMTFMLHRS